MAKRNQKLTTQKWQPGADDAINLATIRWFALSIEAKGIEIYGTNPAVYPDIQKVLGECLTAVAGIKVKKSIAGDSDCPPGWVQCGEDCAPVCLAE